jgi:hypothetical protein
VTAPGATLHLLCFRGDGADQSGPHPVGEDELRAAFADGGRWRVASIAPDEIHTRLRDAPLPAWLARIERI